MIALGCAALFLLVSHFGPASSRLRDLLVRRMGERGYLALYSVVSVLAFAGLVVAYRRAPLYVVWTTPWVVKLALVPVMVLAFALFVGGVTTANPTIVGAESWFDRPGIVRGIVRVTRNPFLWGTGLWALVHVVGTGDLASIFMFGTVAVLGLGGSLVLDAKKASRHPAEWTRFASVTSNLPFAAILAGRQRFTIAEVGWWRIALTLVLFAATSFGHRWAFGVSPFFVVTRN